MSKFFICIFIAVFAATAWSSPTGEGEDERKPGHCRIAGLDIEEGKRVPAPIGQCRNYKCQDASKNSVSSLTCAPFQLEPDSKCHTSEKDLTKPYPQCCPKAVCPDDE